MKTHQAAALAAVALGGVLLLGANSPAPGERQNQPQPRDLEGAWLFQIPSLFVPGAIGHRGNLTVAPLDPSGHQAVGRANNVYTEPVFLAYFDTDKLSDLVGEIIMLDKETARGTFVYYHLKDGQIKRIVLETDTFRLVSRNKLAVEHHALIYDAATDGDGDGLPDPGTPQPDCLVYTSTMTRVPTLVPCSAP